jgi:hypothetical protein
VVGCVGKYEVAIERMERHPARLAHDTHVSLAIRLATDISTTCGGMSAAQKNALSPTAGDLYRQPALSSRA